MRWLWDTSGRADSSLTANKGPVPQALPGPGPSTVLAALAFVSSTAAPAEPSWALKCKAGPRPMGVHSGLPGQPHTHLPGMTCAAAPPPGKVAGTGEQGGRKDRPGSRCCGSRCRQHWERHPQGLAHKLQRCWGCGMGGGTRQPTWSCCSWEEGRPVSFVASVGDQAAGDCGRGLPSAMASQGREDAG